MNLKKFVSGVSAFAVAATAFAAMAVTASATDYTDVIPTNGKLSNITSNGDGTYTVSNTNLGAIIADFSALQDIDDATSVTVQFDTKLPTVTSGGKSYIAPVMFGVGDKAVRGTNGNGSTKSNYVKAGLAAYFGSENGTSYYVNGDTSNNYVMSVKDTDVRATITLNRTTGAYTGKLQTSGASVPLSGTTDVDNLTVLEVTTRGLSGYTFTFKNIKVSYTVPSAPTAGEPVEVNVGGFAEGDGVYAKAFTSDITYDGIAITNVKVEVPGSKEGSQILPLGNLSGDVSIGIIFAAKDASKLEGVTPTITVNAD